jgi:subtilisin family serine protease
MSRYVFAGALALLAAMTASSGVSRPPYRLHAPPAPGRAPLVAIGTRSPAQRHGAAAKLDSVLADLARHASRARPEHALADLHALSPAARFSTSKSTGQALVSVDAVTRGDVGDLEAALASLGLEHPAVYANDVGGWLPVSRLETAAALGEVAALRAAMPRTASVGPVSTQGDFVQGSATLRATYPTLTGTGVTVGVLSDSFDCYSVYAQSGSGVPVGGYEGYAYNGFTADYATDVTTGALPAGVDVLEEPQPSCLDYGAPEEPPFSDEGRAMLQIVHAVAPDAHLAFRTAYNSEADFANGILALQAAGAKVIADDVTYFDEPYFQDGIVAEAINTVAAKGVAYFTAAGNNSDLSYENTAPSFATLATSGPQANEKLLNFDTFGVTTTNALPVTVPAMQPGQLVAIEVEWDQPYVTGAKNSGGATSQLDLCVTGAVGVIVEDYDGNRVSCTGPNALGADPYQILIIANPANAKSNSAQQSLQFSLGLANGTAAPGRVILTVGDDGLGSSITDFATNSATIQGHHNAATAATVGAAFFFVTPACGYSPAELEAYSSAGGAPTLFDTSGARLGTAVVRQKPDFVAPDGANDTFLGFLLGGKLNTSIAACQNNTDYPNFFGTSAATPHAAGIAALILQSNSATTASQIYSALQKTALAMSSPAPNFDSGYGFIQAGAALAEFAPGAPTLSLAMSSVTLGSSTTLSWSAINASGCTASGAWSGAVATSGSKTVTPSATGTTSYSLRCANSVGASPTSTAQLEVTAAPSGGGGGGLDLLSLLGLAALLRGRRRPQMSAGARRS